MARNKEGCGGPIKHPEHKQHHHHQMQQEREKERPTPENFRTSGKRQMAAGISQFQLIEGLKKTRKLHLKRRYWLDQLHALQDGAGVGH
ncbi:uncharacterized protein LOC115095825 isoform X2 [Rhinatrema bivittatum]|uniref:uncharacterized protein LOC115095825 isoform X2 n=1 Tax=Rhinatrema bivittatum TaxID=194408 RepID=UPI00112965B8|nr:uncharacterized protein LOC115095825 isoform X2 [Rhinatrema bivittatum]